MIKILKGILKTDKKFDRAATGKSMFGKRASDVLEIKFNDIFHSRVDLTKYESILEQLPNHKVNEIANYLLRQGVLTIREITWENKMVPKYVLSARLELIRHLSDNIHNLPLAFNESKEDWIIECLKREILYYLGTIVSIYKHKDQECLQALLGPILIQRFVSLYHDIEEKYFL